MRISCNRPQGILLETPATWLHNGTELDSSNSQKYDITASGTELQIMDIGYSDEGNYNCRFVQDGEITLSPGDVLRIVGEFGMVW